MVPDVPAGEDPAMSNDDAVVGVVVSSARLAFVPVRVVARAPLIGSFLRRRSGALQRTGAVARREATERALSATRSALSGPEVRAIIDETLAGPLPEAVVRSAVEHHLAERIAGSVDERAMEEAIQRVIESPAFGFALERALGSPQVRTALTRQSLSFAEEVAATAHNRLVELDSRSGRAAVGNEAGAASRSTAFAVDLVLGQLLFLIGAGLVAIVLSITGPLRPEWLAYTLAGLGWTAAFAVYFVSFWALIGQTPGMRLAGLRVVGPEGTAPGVIRAAVRFAALIVAIIPFFLGLVPILFDARRRGLHDFVAGTTVQYATPSEPPTG
jgi:uncharacterized RDD family membrane protein YckC